MIASAVLLMAFATIANVVARNVFNHSFAAVEELNQFLIVVVCFVGLSYAASQGRHIRMTALYDQLGRRARKALMILVSATTAGLLFVLAWFAFRYAWGVDRVSPVLGVPVYLVYLSAPLGLALGGVQYALTLWKNLTHEEVYVSFEHPDVYHDAPTETEASTPSAPGPETADEEPPETASEDVP